MLDRQGVKVERGRVAALDIAQIRALLGDALRDELIPFDEQRVRLEALSTKAPMPEGIRVEAVDSCSIPAEWVIPEEHDDARCLLYFHGGGYVLGSLASSRPLIAHLAAAVGARALCCGYRLAPEHPYPAALDDALELYRWLTKEAGVAPSRVVLVGTSAGANLALALAQRVRDEVGSGACLELPRAIVGMSAWLDMSCTSDSVVRGDDPMFPKRNSLAMVDAFLAGHDPRDPRVSPLHAVLDGLPPMLLQVGGAEALRDENVAFAARAEAENHALRLELYDDMIHAWHAFVPSLPEAERAIASIAAYIRALPLQS